MHIMDSVFGDFLLTSQQWFLIRSFMY